MSARSRNCSLRGMSRHRVVKKRWAAAYTPQKYQCSPANLVKTADGSAAALVNLLARDFDCFRDEHRYEGRRKPIRVLKRAQILVADVWACFEGEGYGEFRDIDKITMFADYRIPQILNSLGCLGFSPLLDATVRDKKDIPSGSNWELQLRGNHPVQSGFQSDRC